MEDIIKKLKDGIDKDSVLVDEDSNWVYKKGVLIPRHDAIRIVKALEGAERASQASKDLRHLTNEQLIMLVLSKLLKQTKSGTGAALIAELEDRGEKQL
jgi:hypothetical protein